MANRSNPNPRRSSGSGNMDEKLRYFVPFAAAVKPVAAQTTAVIPTTTDTTTVPMTIPTIMATTATMTRMAIMTTATAMIRMATRTVIRMRIKTTTMVMTTAITMAAIRSPISPGKPWPPGQQGVPVPIPIAVRAVPLVVPLAAPSSPGRKSRKSASAMRTIISSPPPAAVEKSIIPSGIS